MKVFILTLLAAGGAWAQNVTVEFDQAVDFSRYRTFAIRDGKVNSRNPVLNSDLVKKQIEADIVRDLSARGLMLAEGKSDLNVRYTLGAVRTQEIETYPAGWRGWGTRVVRVPRTEGTLVINLRDPATQSLVWRAIVTEEKSNASQVQGKLDNMVKKAFDKYPPKAK
jgi:Domain of unknown function (DUF4136)